MIQLSTAELCVFLVNHAEDTHTKPSATEAPAIKSEYEVAVGMKPLAWLAQGGEGRGCGKGRARGGCDPGNESER